jgi:hypothetical protein
MGLVGGIGVALEVIEPFGVGILAKKLVDSFDVDKRVMEAAIT